MNIEILQGSEETRVMWEMLPQFCWKFLADFDRRNTAKIGQHSVKSMNEY